MEGRRKREALIVNDPTDENVQRQLARIEAYALNIAAKLPESTE